MARKKTVLNSQHVTFLDGYTRSSTVRLEPGSENRGTTSRNKYRVPLTKVGFNHWREVKSSTIPFGASRRRK